VVSPRVVHQHAPHHRRRHGEEVAAVHPRRAVLVGQAHVGVVHQGGGVQGVAVALAAQLAVGNAAQLIVDERNQPVQRLAVADPQLNELVGYLGFRVQHGQLRGRAAGSAGADGRGGDAARARVRRHSMSITSEG